MGVGGECVVIYSYMFLLFYDYVVVVTSRSRFTTIRNKIRNTAKEQLFRETCFGWLLHLDYGKENAILVHYFICHQLECRDGDTEIVPLTYRIRDVEIQFGM